MSYININGRIVPKENASLSVGNGAFRYGYGLFETMLLRDGVIDLANYHWNRLFSGMRVLQFGISPLLTAKSLEEQVLATARKNKLDSLCRVRVQVYAGDGGLYELQKTPNVLIECFPLDIETLRLNENGLVVGIAADLNKSVNKLSNLKSCNALIYALAANQAKENKWNDALILNTNNHVIESTISNIFWIRNNQVFTPPLSDGCIAGVMRQFLLEKIPVTEQHLDLSTLLDADEVFLSNSVRRIRWVKSINENTYVIDRIKAIYNDCFSL